MVVKMRQNGQKKKRDDILPEAVYNGRSDSETERKKYKEKQNESI